jgi:hypothetical protein
MAAGGKHDLKFLALAAFGLMVLDAALLYSMSRP